MIAVIYDSDGQPVHVQAEPSSTPGLIVHFSIGDPGWIVTHARSGLCVGMVDTPEDAHALAAALGECGDWTRSGVDIKADHEMRSAAASEPVPLSPGRARQLDEWIAEHEVRL